MALDPLTAGLGLVDKFIGKFVKDKDLATKLQHEARSQEFSGDLALMVGQIEINKIEAAHKSLFVSGWRPAVGWTCCIGFAYNTVIAPFLGIWLVVPEVNGSLLSTVLMGMLGLGAMRSYEKKQGISRNK